MDFISLYDLMDELASNTAPKYSNSEEARYSEAAANLYQALSNSANRPKWAKIDKEPFKLENALKPKEGSFKPIFFDDVSNEVMEMLRHMAGWHRRKIGADSRYEMEQKSAIEQGIDESLVLRSHSPNDGAYKGADLIRAMEIGFNKKEISEFIERFKRQYSPKPEIKPDAGHRAESESVKNEDLSIYEQRKEHFNKWRGDSGADIVSLTDGETLEILKSRNKNLWNLTLGSYRSEFWHPYGRECGIRKRQGRPAKR